MALSTEQKMAKAFTAAGGNGAESLPWDTLITIVMSLFGGCSPKRAKRWAKAFPESVKKLIDDKLKERADALTTKQRAAVVEAAYKTFITAKDAEIESLMP